MEMSRYIERLTPKAEYLETLATSRDILQDAGIFKEIAKLGNKFGG